MKRISLKRTVVPAVAVTPTKRRFGKLSRSLHMRPTAFIAMILLLAVILLARQSQLRRRSEKKSTYSASDRPLETDTKWVLEQYEEASTAEPTSLLTLLIPVRGSLLPRAHLTSPHLCEANTRVELDVVFAVTKTMSLDDAEVALGGTWSKVARSSFLGVSLDGVGTPYLARQSFEVDTLYTVSDIPDVLACVKSVHVAVVETPKHNSQHIVPLPQLVLAGLAVSSPTASHFLVMSEAHVPLSNRTGSGFVEGMLKPFLSPLSAGGIPVAVQCTVLQPAEYDSVAPTGLLSFEERELGLVKQGGPSTPLARDARQRLSFANVTAPYLTSTGDGSSAAGSAFTVVDKGFEVGRALAQLHITRRLSGHLWDDARLRTTDRVELISPSCMMVDKRKYLLVGGLAESEATFHANKHLGWEFTAGDRKRLITVIRLRVLLIEYLMQTVSKNDMDVGGLQLRDELDAAYKTALSSVTQWQTVTGQAFDREILNSREAAMNLFDHEPLLREFLHAPKPLVDRLRSLAKHLVRETDALGETGGNMGDRNENSHMWNQWLRLTTSTEESIGWDLSLRLQAFHRDWRLMSVANTALLLREMLPTPLLKYYQLNHVTPAYPSYMLFGSFEAAWGPTLGRMHQSRAGVPFTQTYNVTKVFHNTLSEPTTPVRIYWHSHCCKCCGFASEIANFVYPLSRRREVHLFNGESCFCKGYPSGKLDALQRAHTPEDFYAKGERLPNEVTIWISHTDPLSFKQALVERRPASYVVGRAMHEFSRVSAEWVKALNNDCDEVWVPSSFVRSVFLRSGANEDRLVLIPEAVDTYYYDPAAHEPLPLPLQTSRPQWCVWENYPLDTPEQYQRNYKFYSSFKWEPRKGWDTLLTAYQRAFGGNGATTTAHVSLYIQTIFFKNEAEDPSFDYRNPALIVNDLEQWLVRSGVCGAGCLRDRNVFPHVVITTEHLPEADEARLYRTADAFVLPTRGEGWGLPTIQAMAMGLPTISTNYGGNTDFMSTSTSFLIPIDGVEELDTNSIYGYAPGKRWAIPSTEGTQKLMRYVYDNPQAAKAVGARARADIHRRFSSEIVTDVVDARVETIKKIVSSRHGR